MSEFVGGKREIEASSDSRFDETPGSSHRQLLAMFVPLALSNALMAVAEAIVTAGVARLPQPETSLAAVGVALSAAVLIESPIIMMLHAANALVAGPRSYRRVFVYMAAIGGALTVLHALLALTPLYGVVFRQLLGLPEHVAAAARTGFVWLLPWTFFIGWRRFYQGILINHGRTQAIGWGTAVRILALSATLGVGAFVLRWPGVAVAGMALSVGVIAEALFITGAAYRQVLPAHPEWLGVGVLPRFGVGAAGEASPAVLSWSSLHRFYWPLAFTAVIVFVVRPVVPAALARGALAEVSLAAWPVVLSVVFLVTGPVRSLQQLVIAAGGGSPEHLRRTGRFAAGVGAVFALAFAAAVFTPAMDLYARWILGVTDDVRRFSVISWQWLLLMPALVAAQNWFQGRLVSRRATGAINGGAAVNAVVLTAVLFGGVALSSRPAVLIAAGAMLLGYLAEVTFLAAVDLRKRRRQSKAPAGDVSG